LVTMHHIVSDGWSAGVFMRELSVLYEAHCQGRSAQLPELPIQYADYAVWQRERMQGEFLAEQLGYWREQLKGLRPLLELPADGVRPAVQRYRGAYQSFQVRGPVVAGLRGVSEQAGVTQFMTLLAAFAVLLWRYTGEREVVVGTPIAGRTRAETEGLIGFFVNTLVLRTELSGELSFAELLQRVREVTLGAYAHQELPFEKLVEELQPERNLSYNPLFQVMFVLQGSGKREAGEGAAEEGGESSEAADGPQLMTGTAKFDLTLSMQESGGVLWGAVEYNTDLFSAARVARLVGHYEQLLKSIVSNPQQRLGRLEMLSRSEREQLLSQNEPVQAVSGTVLELFAAQVASGAQRVALVAAEQELSYQELAARANQWAHYLRSVGVAAETVVGICLPRGVEQVVAVLGVLKSGGAYLPLEAGYPAERLELMLRESGAELVITNAKLAESLPASVRKLVVETVAAEVSIQPVSDCAVAIAGENLAYVIYTSGSTGTPKGVAMTHRALTNLIRWQTSDSRAATTLQYAPLTFDVSFQEIFSTLCSGGRLITVGDEERSDFKRLLHQLASTNVERLFLPCVALHHLAETFAGTGIDSDCLQLREIIVAGEQLQITPAIASFLERIHVNNLANHYGPSETHVATAFDLAVSSGDWPTFPPIGRPIRNAEVYILDEEMEPVPVGINGELYVGGVGLARGYLHRPELTAEKFVPHPFSHTPGSRLYRTGDQARYAADGNLEFVGRKDQQVKLRGFRIELNEIEAVLNGHESVRESVVVVRSSGSGDKRLVAYVVKRAEAEYSELALRQYLKQKLPEYMVPAVLVQLAELPLGTTGKVDRQALPEVEAARPELETKYVAPRTAVEEDLARIWREVLVVPHVGVEDNFFELGGHSLLAARTRAQIMDEFEIELPLVSIFERPTLSALAELVTQLQKHDGNGSRYRGRIPRYLPTAEDFLPSLKKLSAQEIDTLLIEILTEEVRG